MDASRSVFNSDKDETQKRHSQWERSKFDDEEGKCENDFLEMQKNNRGRKESRSKLAECSKMNQRKPTSSQFELKPMSGQKVDESDGKHGEDASGPSTTHFGDKSLQSERQASAFAKETHKHHGAAPDNPEVPLPQNCDDEDTWDDFEEFVDNDTTVSEMPVLPQNLGAKSIRYDVYRVCYVLYLLAFVVYFYVRVAYTLGDPVKNIVLSYHIVVLVAEIMSALSVIIEGLCLFRWTPRNPSQTTAFEPLPFHTCRIMVPTYKEPLEMVAKTVHEIIHMKLPPDVHCHVYVLDDGKRADLEDWVLCKRTKRAMHLHYIARPKLPGVRNNAKAGNINHALHFIYDNASAEGECVAIFDADFIPSRYYLIKVLPVFLEKREKLLGLVQTPQFFYNVKSSEDVWDHLNVSFYHRIEPSLGRWNAVNCCGTNFIVRADSLKQVGYMPVGCLTEDTLLSLRLCKMGWGVAYHHEILAVGQCPQEITEIFKQRFRWCKGNLQIFFNEFPMIQSGLSLSKRLFYSANGYNYFCISIFRPFFQLVPIWGTFFGVWPVSSINWQFACSFSIYYLLVNILLLFPPPRFGVRDMWNGDWASTNLWFTYLTGVFQIVRTKIFRKRGNFVFKTTKKKVEQAAELSKGGFKWKDIKACIIHFIMFFIVLGSIIYAIIKVAVATDVKFYFYYMHAISVSWLYISLIPYLIAIVYCWCRVRIPSSVVVVFQFLRLLAMKGCAGLILMQAFTTKNLTAEYNFVCGHAYEAKLGLSQLTLDTTVDESTGLYVERNAFWLLGLEDDFYTMQQVKRSSCYDATIPVIVFFMHPSQGLMLEVKASHYMPKERIGTWEEYDKKLENYAEHLADIPSIIIMEPALLMHTFNSKTEYHNPEYQLAYAARVENVLQKFPNSWVYVDAGDAVYLQWTVNLEHIISVLKKMPANVRGFSVNVGSFVNSTFNQQLAEEIHCQTGLHYIVDTSRNGGDFSTRSIEEISECIYDPPMVEKGATPSWQSGATLRLHQAEQLSNTYNTVWPSKERRKRWEFFDTSSSGAGAPPVYEADNPAAGGSLPGGGGGGGGGGGQDYGDPEYGIYDYDYYYGGADSGKAKACISPEGQDGLDAFAWVKTPGESDGRMFSAGTFHPCLLGHSIECTDTCPQYVPQLSGEFQRSDSCKCIDG